MIPPVLRELLTAAGASGNETAPAAVFRRACAEFAEVTSDTVGSSFARVPGRGEAPRLAIFGHVDEIGLTISHIDDDGYLWFQGIGGWDSMILVGQRVRVVTADGAIPGVVGKKPIHLLQTEERKKVPEMKDLHIDIGAADGDEARALVAIGDFAVIDVEPVELPNGRIASRAMDNRLGVFVAYEAARLIAEAGGAPGDVVAVAPVQEETVLAGAATSAFGLAPEVAIVVDVTHATDAPGVSEQENGRHRFGSGPCLSRATTLHPKVFTLLKEAAEAEGIHYTVAAGGRGTWTDADSIHLARDGIPTGLVEIPLRYMHSPVEMVQLDDVMACARVIAAFAQRLTADVSFIR